MFPERLLKSGASGPSGAFARNPVVGETPASHDLPDSVAKPRPNNLSKNAQRIMKDMDSLNRFQMLFSEKSFMGQL